MPARLLFSLWLLLLAGCAGTSGLGRFARLPDGKMCKHCNCLMPADVDPAAVCPACDCGYHAHQCERGR